jgi:hypothetical protein
VVVVGPGGGKALAASAPAIASWLKSGGNLLAIGLDEEDANAFLPCKIETKNAEHISAYFDPFDARSLLAGVGPADFTSTSRKNGMSPTASSAGERKLPARPL